MESICQRQKISKPNLRSASIFSLYQRHHRLPQPTKVEFAFSIDKCRVVSAEIAREKSQHDVVIVTESIPLMRQFTSYKRLSNICFLLEIKYSTSFRNPNNLC